MSRNICIVQDFLTQTHKEQIRATAEKNGFTPYFFTTSGMDAVKSCLREKNCEIVYAGSTEVLRAAPPCLQWFASSAAGADAYCSDPSLFANPDCMLTSANVYGVTIAEHVIMVTLMLLRRMPEYETSVRKQVWSVPLPVHSIRDGSFVILGTGQIGRNIAERLHGMGAARVVGLSRSGRPVDGFDEVRPVSRLDETLPEASFLIMVLPGTPETVGILNERRIQMLPDGAYVVNVGRGSAVEQDALCQALRTGKLAGAALDVMTPEPLPAGHPLWNTENLILTPHISGNMTLGYTADANVALFCENLTRYAAGEQLKCLVDRSRGY